jgi:hypothetical protein
LNLRQESQERRARNRAAGLAALRRLGTVTIQTRNRGTHLIVTTKNKVRFDYWPGTGKWRSRTTPVEEARGIQSLLQRIGQEEISV